MGLVEVMGVSMSDREENCECGLKEDGTWSEEVFDRYGCGCEENEHE